MNRRTLLALVIGLGAVLGVAAMASLAPSTGATPPPPPAPSVAPPPPAAAAPAPPAPPSPAPHPSFRAGSSVDRAALKQTLTPGTLRPPPSPTDLAAPAHLKQRPGSAAISLERHAALPRFDEVDPARKPLDRSLEPESTKGLDD